MIARFVAGFQNNTGLAGQWKFAPASRGYATFADDLGSEDFDAILVGEVSGNWTPPGAFAAPLQSQEPEFVVPNDSGQPAGKSESIDKLKIDDQSGVKGIEVTLAPTIIETGKRMVAVVPVMTGDTTGKGIASYDFQIDFDPNVLQLAEMPIDTNGGLSNGWTVSFNPSVPGRIIVSGFGMNDLKGSGALLNLKFNVVGAIGKNAPVSIRSFMFNDGFPAVK